MNELQEIFLNYGLPVFLIALAGVVILGILKYCNLFKKVAEKYRHYIYLAISVGLSIIATIIYLLVVGQFTAVYFASIAAAIFTLNQAAYNVFKITSVNELAAKAFDAVIARIAKLFKKDAENTENEEKKSGE